MRKAMIAISILACAAQGCTTSFEAPPDDGETIMDNSAFLGEWEVVRFLGEDVSDGTVVISQEGAELSATYAISGSQATMTGEIVAIGGRMIAAGRHTNHWFLAELVEGEGANQIEVLLPNSDILVDAIDESNIAGTYADMGMGSKAVRISSDGTQLRSFLQQEPDLFDSGMSILLERDDHHQSMASTGIVAGDIMNRSFLLPSALALLLAVTALSVFAKRKAARLS